jgi:hypothetical protein
MTDLDGQWGWKETVRVLAVASFAACIARSAGICAGASLAYGLASAYNTHRCVTCKTFARSMVKTIALSAVGYGIGANS